MKKLERTIQTFGFEKNNQWEYPIIKILFSLPRLYYPLIESLDIIYPGTKKYIKTLINLGFLSYQNGIIYDTKNSIVVKKISKPQNRYIITNKGESFLNEIKFDIRVINDKFPKIKAKNYNYIINFFNILNLDDTHAKYGISASHISQKCKIPIKNVRYWLDIFIKSGYIRKLKHKIADKREVIPYHVRVNKSFSKQLKIILKELDNGELIKNELKLNRKNYLNNIIPSRVGISGATDYDHDIEVQKILSKFILSKKIIEPLSLIVEPKFKIKVNKNLNAYISSKDGNNILYYQPDALFFEYIDNTRFFSILEFERYQNRKDGWIHIEKLLCFAHQNLLPFEGIILRFVVGSEKRLNSYLDLLEAFAHYISINTDKIPNNKIIFSLATTERIYYANDALDDNNWYRINIIGSDNAVKNIAIHEQSSSPYSNYFGK